MMMRSNIYLLQISLSSSIPPLYNHAPSARDLPYVDSLFYSEEINIKLPKMINPQLSDSISGVISLSSNNDLEIIVT